MKKSSIVIALMAFSLIAIVSCTKGDELEVVATPTPTEPDPDPDPNVPVVMADLQLLLVEMDPLGDGFIYEGWLIVDGVSISTGTFDATVNEYTFTTIASDLETATGFMISIEPVPDTDPTPSNTRILSGQFDGNAASLTLDEIADFSDISGRFEIFTPSAATINDAFPENGIWFVRSSETATGREFEAGLDLPTLATGWKYEGWVVFDKDGSEFPVSTGDFIDVASFDGASFHSGSNPNRPFFPGEDFFDNDLTFGDITLNFPEDGSVFDRRVFISVEPDPDPSEDPFFIVPLLARSGSLLSPVFNQMSIGDLDTQVIVTR